MRRAFRGKAEQRLAGRHCLVAQSDSWRAWVFQTGVGQDQAALVMREAFSTESFDLAVSTGFACALIPSRIGDLLIGTTVTFYPSDPSSGDAPEFVSCAETFTQLAYDLAQGAGLRAQKGHFITSPHVVCTAREKMAINSATGAIALDMESSAIGAIANARGVPFLVARTASDLVDESFPMDFNLFMDRGTRLRAALAVLASPAMLGDLYRLRKQTNLAASRLTTFFEHFPAAWQRRSERGVVVGC